MPYGLPRRSCVWRGGRRTETGDSPSVAWRPRQPARSVPRPQRTRQHGLTHSLCLANAPRLGPKHACPPTGGSRHAAERLRALALSSWAARGCLVRASRHAVPVSHAACVAPPFAPDDRSHLGLVVYGESLMGVGLFCDATVGTFPCLPAVFSILRLSSYIVWV